MDPRSSTFGLKELQFPLISSIYIKFGQQTLMSDLKIILPSVLYEARLAL
jgi:hypothetical protein